MTQIHYFFPGKNNLVLFFTLLCRAMLQKWTIQVYYIWFHQCSRTRRIFYLETSQKSMNSTTGMCELLVVLSPCCCWLFYCLFTGCFVTPMCTQAGKVILTLPLYVSYKTHVWRIPLRSSMSSICERLSLLCIHQWSPLALLILNVSSGKYFLFSLDSLINVPLQTC